MGANDLVDASLGLRGSNPDTDDETADARDSVVNAVLIELREALLERNSSLASGLSLDPALETQTRSILDEVFAEMQRIERRPDAAAITVDYAAPSSLTAHGQNAAARDVDPAEPLMAAELIFDIALTVITDHRYQLNDPGDPVLIARTLHHAIWRRFPPGAIAYVNVLRERLAASYSEGRLRLAREIHDRFAHGIAAGVQRVELSTTSADVFEAQHHLDEALRLFRVTMADMQGLAYDLRQFVGDRSLDDALAAHVQSQKGIPVLTFSARDRERALPTKVKEEAFAIVLEAIRNSRAHAEGATEISIVSQWTGNTLILEVSDNGTNGQSTSHGHTPLGMTGMTERARAIGGTLRVLSRRPGTTVRLEVPFSAS